MASEAAQNKERRFFGGPRAVGALLPTVTRAAFRQRSAAGAQLMADWPSVIGPALAAVTFPKQLTGGTLTLLCSGPIALELQHLTGTLAERINAHFGRIVVERFRFVQGQVAGAPRVAARHKTLPGPPVEIPGMAPGPLRDALAALGAAVAGEGDRDSA